MGNLVYVGRLGHSSPQYQANSNGQNNKEEEDIKREEDKEQERVQDTDRNQTEDSGEEANGDDFSDYSDSDFIYKIYHRKEH